jgi:hypothetical protein
VQLGFDFASDRRGSGGRCHFSARDADDALHLRLDIGWQGHAHDRDVAGDRADGAPREDVEEGGCREYEPTQGFVHKRRRVQDEIQLLFRD